MNPVENIYGRVAAAGVGSIIDFNPFQENGHKFSYLGNGKNGMQAGLDFGFGVMGESMKYTFGTLGGVGIARDAITTIGIGNVNNVVQNAAEKLDK